MSEELGSDAQVVVGASNMNGTVGDIGSSFRDGWSQMMSPCGG